jgi:hypothetical protein
MTELVENTALWNNWKFRMPVIMNCDSAGTGAGGTQ